MKVLFLADYLKKTLESVLERWSQAQQWVHDRVAKLVEMRAQEEQLAEECSRLQQWLGTTETTLINMEVEPAEAIPQLMARVDKICAVYAEVSTECSIILLLNFKSHCLGHSQ